MEFNADIGACAALVQRADPDRFRATMAAPVSARAKLFPIYAMNVEVARAPWVTQEEMIAEMRLQWWRDALLEISDGDQVRRHEVVTPLAAVLSPNLSEALDGLVLARRWDIYRDPFESQADLDRYIDQTSGTLLWAAVRSLGDADESVVRDFGYAAGVANWLQAVPELEAQGRIPLLDGTQDGIKRLARTALERLQSARAQRGRISAVASPALLSGWQTEATLKQAVKDPARVANGALGQSEARKRLGLMIKAATGRW